MDDGTVGPQNSSLALAQSPQETRRALLHLAAEIIAYSDATEGLIHEIRNPLQSLIFAARTLVDLPTADPDGKLLAVIGQAAESAATTVDLLSGVSDSRKREGPPVTLQDLVPRVLAWQRRSRLCINGPLASSIPAAIPPIAASEREIETALMLIVNNAKEAIGRDGSGRVEIAASAAPGKVVITISDTGSGIESGFAEAAFGLFVTTKEDHLGIGLTAARSLVEANGGTVLLRNQDGCGAICEMSLPSWRGE